MGRFDELVGDVCFLPVFPLQPRVWQPLFSPLRELPVLPLPFELALQQLLAALQQVPRGPGSSRSERWGGVAIPPSLLGPEFCPRVAAR